MDDGTWGEIARDGNFCEYCAAYETDSNPFTASCEHWDLTHDRYIMTDGRILDEHTVLVPSDGNSMTTSGSLVLVTDDTYTTPDASKVIYYLTGARSPMESTLVRAYEKIEQALDGHAQILLAHQPNVWASTDERYWVPFATMTVRDAQGDDRTYLILEDGQYFEYDKAVYKCNECAFSSPNEDWTDRMHTHERTALFHLTAGGTYSARINWETHEFGTPVYTP